MQRVHISPAMGSRRVADVTTADVEALARSMLRRGLAPKSVRNVITFLHSELAAKWARLVMIGPQHFAGQPSTDQQLADRLAVPLEQVALARREFGHRISASG